MDLAALGVYTSTAVAAQPRGSCHAFPQIATSSHVLYGDRGGASATIMDQASAVEHGKMHISFRHNKNNLIGRSNRTVV